MLKIEPKRIGKKSGGEVDRKQKDYAWNRWKMGEKKSQRDKKDYCVDTTNNRLLQRNNWRPRKNLKI